MPIPILILDVAIELLIFLAAVAAGMMNSIAGGGTLVTFPALIWAGLPPITANATNALALVPAGWSSMFGYRQSLREMPRRFTVLVIPSTVGAAIGAMLLRRTPPPTFELLVPFLIFFATVLFMVQGAVQRWLRTSEMAHHPVTTGWLIGASIYQFVVGIYGGYFGAGMGILMLAVLGMMGMSDIHQMNGLKNLIGSFINLIAALYFIYSGLIDWPTAALMSVGTIIGGYAAAGIATRLPQSTVRRVVILLGLAMAVSLFLRERL